MSRDINNCEDCIKNCIGLKNFFWKLFFLNKSSKFFQDVGVIIFACYYIFCILRLTYRIWMHVNIDLQSFQEIVLVYWLGGFVFISLWTNVARNLACVAAESIVILLSMIESTDSRVLATRGIRYRRRRRMRTRNGKRGSGKGRR